jgi:hypothetical protein
VIGSTSLHISGNYLLSNYQSYLKGVITHPIY